MQIDFVGGSVYKPIDQCLIEAYASFNVPPLGGASNDGWSKLSDYQRCPYRYYMLHEAPKTAEAPFYVAPESLEIGSLMHAMLAMHYMKGMRGVTNYPTAYALAERVRSLNASPGIVDECKRLYAAYANHYQNPHDEGLQPLAVEYPAGVDGIHTCRYDMLAKRDGGVWNYETKTASRETREVTEGWWLDGEIIGQHYAYKLSGLDKLFGPLIGTCINIIIKTQVPKFRRVEVVIPDDVLDAYIADSKFWRGQRDSMRAMRYFPRKLQGCIGRYSMCELWDHCRNADATDSERLTRMLQLSIDKNEKG